MQLIPLQLPSGVYRNGTDMQSANRWADSNLVRWASGTLQPVGGWQQWSATTMAAKPRGAHAWIDNLGNRRLAFGTFNKLYYYSAAGAQFDITPVGITAGIEDAELLSGFSSSFYGTSFYGVARPQALAPIPATTWALDNFGEYLVACSNADGKLYEWQLDTGTPAAVIANAPTSCTSLVVAPERFLLALGSGGNPRKVAWSDREDNTTWTPASTNEAGDIELQSSGEIKCGVRVQGQTLILTTTDAHSMTYIGPPYVFSTERVGSSCGIASAKAVAVVDRGAFWLGREGFFVYANGQVSSLPCDVWDYVYRDKNDTQISKAFAVSNARHNEIWWFYPSSGDTENDRYVTYNYAENTWAIGELSRTTGIDAGAFRNPIWATATTYEHEYGFQYDALTPFAETGPISIAVGDDVMVVTGMIPDELTQGQVTATFKTRFHPNDTERTYGAYSMSNPTSFRLTGRQVRMRVEGAANADWRVGVNRLQATAGGKR